METKIYKYPTEKEIECIGKMLRDGCVVALPTETVYGLGANGLDETAMDKIYQAKGRPSDNPLILHVPSMEAVTPLVREISETAHRLMETFWPGPLTITLPKSDLVPYRATGGLDRVALRCPNHELCRSILQAAGVPIAAPSANISGRPSPTSAEAVLHDMKGRIDAIVDAGNCQIGVESTVVEVNDNKVTILRPGGITKDMLEKVVDTVVYDTHMVTGNGVPKAPGMKYKHYAPDGEMTTLVGDPLAVAREMARMMTTLSGPIGLLISQEAYEFLHTIVDVSKVHCIIYGHHQDDTSLANKLYASLLEFNKQGVTHILAEGVKSEGMGVAIMNRMEKSSDHRIVIVKK